MLTSYAITVDTEEEWDWSSGYPTGPACVRNIAHLPHLQAICDRHGAATTYFANYAVLANADSAQVVCELAHRPRVEIGMHIHPWNTPPLASAERVPDRDSFLHNLPPDLIVAKLDTVYAEFVKQGLKPVTFRGGRYSTGPVIQQWLREHHFMADTSILPYSSWADDGAPDYRTCTPDPVRTAEGLWELPLSLAFTARPFELWRNVLETASVVPKLTGLLGKLGGPERAWLNFENPLGERMRPLVRALRGQKLPYLCFTLHSSSLMAGGSPYAPTEAAVRAIYARIDRVLADCAADPKLEAATMREIADSLEANYHACHRD